MAFARTHLLGIVLGLSAAACQPSQNAQVVPGPDSGAGKRTADDRQQQQQTNTATSNNGSKASGPATGDSSIPIELKASELKAKYGLDTANLTYHFIYQTIDTTGPIKFTGDTATLNFTGLKPNEKGHLALEVLQGGVVKLRGELVDLVLQPGAVRLPLVMKPVGGQTGGDLTIEVTIEGPTTGGGTDTSTETTATTGTTTGTTVTTGTTTSTGTTITVNPGTGTGPSFAKDIKPILDKNCAECHHAGGTLPDLSILPSADVANTIIQLVTNKAMPKAPRDPLSGSEISKITDWKNAGRNP